MYIGMTKNECTEAGPSKWGWEENRFNVARGANQMHVREKATAKRKADEAFTDVSDADPEFKARNNPVLRDGQGKLLRKATFEALNFR